MDQRQIDLATIQRVAGGNLPWVAVALLLLVLVLFSYIRFGKVTAEEVGIKLNKINGKVTVINQPGTHRYNGITDRFFVLDKTLQSVEMTLVANRGERQGQDNLKIKTVDGSDVYVDLKVQYFIDPDMADVVIRTSGPKDAYKQKWVRDYVRSLCRNYLGELTTEQFYDAGKRDVKILAAKEEANRRLKDFGLEIDNVVIPTRPNFYKEYEELIKRKKLADQAVLEEKSKELAAKQRQRTMTVTETNKKNVAVEQYTGEMEQRIIAAEAEGERARKGGDAYFDRVTIGAEASFYEMQKRAEATLALKQAEAKGIEALKEALEGEGGRNMVKLEYAKKLKDVVITGRPYTVGSDTRRFEHVRDDTAAQATSK